MINFLIAARGWTNVYLRSIGCFKDKARRAAGSMVANLRGLKFAVRDCARQARKRGYRIFALQNGGECFMGPRAKITYKKYGPSKRCRGGKGGPWANNVYIIIVKGMFQDIICGFCSTDILQINSIGPNALVVMRNGFFFSFSD